MEHLNRNRYKEAFCFLSLTRASQFHDHHRRIEPWNRSRRGFAVQTIWGDSILRLADENTFLFAAAEEYRYKRMVSRLCDTRQKATDEILRPWLDVLSRK